MRGYHLNFIPKKHDGVVFQCYNKKIGLRKAI